MDIAALIISILALGLSLIQFIKNTSYQKKESTLFAYQKIQNEVFSKLTKFPYPMPEIKSYSDIWTELTICLAKLEQFSVGVNTGIYSLYILNRLGGEYYIRQFEKLKPIITKKREENIVSGKHYNEFEITVNKLKKKQKKQAKRII